VKRTRSNSPSPRTGRPEPAGRKPVVAAGLPWTERTAVHFLLIIALGVLAYGNTFHVPFTFDDITSLVEKPVIRDLGSFLGRADGYLYNPRRFVANLTFALNYRVGGLSVFGYHVVNLLIHLCSALLVYLLTRLTLASPHLAKSRLVSGFRSLPPVAGLLFVVHPVATQAVTYVVQRYASLATLFYLASLVCFAAARNEQERLGRRLAPSALLRFGAATLAGLLALATKEISFTLPFALLLYEGMFYPMTRFKRLLVAVAGVVGALVFLGVAFVAGGRIGALLTDVGQALTESRVISRGDYLLTQFRVLVTYLRLLVLPVGQNLDYAYPIAKTLFSLPVLASLLFLALLFAGAVALLVRAGRGGGEPLLRLIAFGIFWFFLTLSIESSIIPITDVIFEHRLYLPLAGVSMAAAAGFSLLGRYLPRAAGRLLVAVVVILLALATWQRNGVWGDSVALWRDVIAKSPGKARPYNELGKVYFDRKAYPEAVAAYREGLRLDPAFAPACNNLGVVLLKLGDLDGAIAQYERFLQLKPDFAEAHNNLGAAYRKKGNFAAAMEQYRIALRLKPDYASAYNNMGVAYALQGKYAEAAEQFATAVRLQPDNGEFRENLAKVYDLRGEKEKAAAVRAGK
jgi:tetratricopeptide (TPR) repeat protein